MKQKITKTLIVSLVLLIFLGLLAPIFAASEPYSNDAYWRSLCSTSYTDNKSDCEAYRKYKLDEIQANKDKLQDIEKQQANIKNDISKVLEEIKKSDAVIEDIEVQIDAISQEIYKTQDRISKINHNIELRIVEISDREKDVAEIMVLTQSSYRTNDYLEFIMGSQDFSDMMRRMAGVNAFKRSMDTTIERLTEAKVALEEDRVAVEKEKENLESSRKMSETAVEEAKVLRDSQKSLYSVLYKKQNEFLAAAESIKVQNIASQKVIDSIGPIEASTGFTWPVRSGFRVTHGAWTYYDDGQPHMGVDLATSIGTPMVAAGNGVVAAAEENGCNNLGGSNCGGGYGNYVSIITNINGKIYGVLYAHMSSGSISVTSGQEISAGQHIGSVGNSGASYGAHVHAEVVYLGSDSVQEAFRRWAATGSSNFGTGSANAGGRRCDQGFGAPCRMNPQNAFGLTVRKSY